MSENGNKESRNIREASSRGIKIVFGIAVVIIFTIVAISFFGKSTKGTPEQIAVQNAASTIYQTAQANVNTGTLLANGQVVTQEQFPELPVTIATNSLYTSGQIDNNDAISLLTDGGVDPTMEELQSIINAPAYEIKVNSQGQLIALPGN